MSNIYQHTHNNNSGQGKSSEKDFVILDKASTQFKLKIKEAMRIKQQKPSLNKQIKHINLILDI